MLESYSWLKGTWDDRQDLLYCENIAYYGFDRQRIAFFWITFNVNFIDELDIKRISKDFYRCGALEMEDYSVGIDNGVTREFFRNGNKKTLSIRGRISENITWDQSGKILYHRVFLRDIEVPVEAFSKLRSGQLVSLDILEVKDFFARLVLKAGYGDKKFIKEIEEKRPDLMIVFDTDKGDRLVRINWQQIHRDASDQPLLFLDFKDGSQQEEYEPYPLPPYKNIFTVEDAKNYLYGVKDYSPVAES